MVRMENITNRELLSAYIAQRYPQQSANNAVCVISLDEIEFEGEFEMLKQELAKADVLPSGYFLHPGNLIIEMPAGLANKLCNEFSKAGFTILIYQNGEIVHENQ